MHRALLVGASTDAAGYNGVDPSDKWATPSWADGLPYWAKIVISLVVFGLFGLAMWYGLKRCCAGCASLEAAKPQPCANGCNINVAGKNALVTALQGGIYCEECQRQADEEERRQRRKEEKRREKEAAENRLRAAQAYDEQQRQRNNM